MSKNTYNITQDVAMAVIGGKTYQIRSGTLNFLEAKLALVAEHWDRFIELTSVGKGIQKWTNDFITYADGKLTCDGQDLPQELMDRIIAMAEKGENPTFLMNFWKNLCENPDEGSVKSLYGFLMHHGIPIDAEGYILAYKGINEDYTDKWTGSIDNTPGSVIEMDRDKVTNDPNLACAPGLHLGSHKYALGWAGGAGRAVICRVHPRDVVSVPTRETEKMRCCRYQVLGNYGDKLNDLVYEEDADDNDGVDLDGPLEVQPWDDFDSLSEAELYDQTLDHLRKYARHYLNIIGASKIRGGKPALVARILEVRRDA